MSDPFEVLGLPRQAAESEVRQRYLELVRQSPPDRDPERFAEVRAAYDAVRDPARRLEAQLFEVATSETLDTIARDLRGRLRDRLAHAPIDLLLRLAESP